MIVNKPDFFVCTKLDLCAIAIIGGGSLRNLNLIIGIKNNMKNLKIYILNIKIKYTQILLNYIIY